MLTALSSFIMNCTDVQIQATIYRYKKMWYDCHTTILYYVDRERHHRIRKLSVLYTSWLSGLCAVHFAVGNLWCHKILGSNPDERTKDLLCKLHVERKTFKGFFFNLAGSLTFYYLFFTFSYDLSSFFLNVFLIIYNVCILCYHY